MVVDVDDSEVEVPQSDGLQAAGGLHVADTHIHQRVGVVQLTYRRGQQHGSGARHRPNLDGS